MENKMQKSIIMLQAVCKNSAINDSIARACEACERELTENSNMAWTYRVAESDLNDAGIATPLKSLWVFAFRAGASSEIHKHSNSTQYTAVWRGEGRMKVGDSTAIEESQLNASADGSLMEREWVTIPPGTYHQAVAGGTDWYVVSFHTVVAEELQEEPLVGTSHHYVAR